MRLRDVVFGSSLLVAAFAVACSSKPADDSTSEDDSTKAPDRDGTQGAPVTDPPPATTDTPTTDDPDAGTADPDASTTGDGGVVVTTGDGGKSCSPTSVAEMEPNDTEGTANVLPNVSGSICGRLTTNADVDFATFTMPADKTYLFTGYAVSSGGVTLTLTVDGQSFQAGKQPIVKPGSKYILKATSTNTKEVDYRVDYKFEQ